MHTSSGSYPASGLSLGSCPTSSFESSFFPDVLLSVPGSSKTGFSYANATILFGAGISCTRRIPPVLREFETVRTPGHSHNAVHVHAVSGQRSKQNKNVSFSGVSLPLERCSKKEKHSHDQITRSNYLSAILSGYQLLSELVITKRDDSQSAMHRYRK